MTQSGNIRQNKGLLDFADQRFAGQHIIDTSTDVSCLGAGVETPPAIGDGVRMNMPEGIDQSGVEKQAISIWV